MVPEFFAHGSYSSGRPELVAEPRLPGCQDQHGSYPQEGHEQSLEYGSQGRTQREQERSPAR